MALLFDDPTICSAALAGPAAPRAPDGSGFAGEALIADCKLDPADFQVRLHELCNGSGFAPGSVLVTVVNRRVRASRTYLSGGRPDDWLREFEQDLKSGVFSR